MRFSDAAAAPAEDEEAAAARRFATEWYSRALGLVAMLDQVGMRKAPRLGRSDRREGIRGAEDAGGMGGRPGATKPSGARGKRLGAVLCRGTEEGAGAEAVGRSRGEYGGTGSKLGTVEWYDGASDASGCA